MMKLIRPIWPAIILALFLGLVIPGASPQAHRDDQSEPDEHRVGDCDAERDDRRNDDEDCRRHHRDPIQVNRRDDLYFGTLIKLTGRGYVQISPQNGAQTVSGSVMATGDTHHAATFLIQGEPDALFSINLPDEVILSSAGSRHLRIRHLRSQPELFSRLDAMGRARVVVGGRLGLPNREVSGEFQGRFDIAVRYQ